jgi:hypothetical protein
MPDPHRTDTAPPLRRDATHQRALRKLVIAIAIAIAATVTLASVAAWSTPANAGVVNSASAPLDDTFVPAAGQSSPSTTGDSPASGDDYHVTVQNTTTMNVPSYTPEGRLIGPQGWSIGYGCLVEHHEVCGAVVSRDLTTALSNAVKFGGMGAIAALSPVCITALSHFMDPTAATFTCASIGAWASSKLKGIGPYCLFLPDTPPEWQGKILTVYCGRDNSPPTS